MNAAEFLDTNVLLYAVCPDDPRSIRAAEILTRGGTISVQVLNEFASVARRKLKRSWPDITIALRDFRAVLREPTALTAGVHDHALTLAAATGYTFYDALIVASALDAGCTTLLSEDMQDGQVIEGRLTIRNPFRTGGP